MSRYFIEEIGDGCVHANSPEEAEHTFKHQFAAAIAAQTGSIGYPKKDIHAGWVVLVRADFGRFLRKGFRVKEFKEDVVHA